MKSMLPMYAGILMIVLYSLFSEQMSAWPDGALPVYLLAAVALLIVGVVMTRSDRKREKGNAHRLNRGNPFKRT